MNSYRKALNYFCLITGMMCPVNLCAQPGTNINNPVLPGVADAGVIKYNGEYYIGGVNTTGGFYVSKDLVKWEGPVKVFTMDNDWIKGSGADDRQIHANDINYINGLFHMYWSVNYWGNDKHVVHIGHATSTNVLGPYKEPVKNTWLDNRIDAEFFVDDDGKMYLYMVKFTDGNTIWVQPMKDPGTAVGNPLYLFSSMQNTWETLDNRVEEGPWVIKYRDRYYLMFNANHTSTNWGNYALGVAEASSPLGFNHGNKYTYPVVNSNQIKVEETFVDLLKFNGKEPGIFDFTFNDPGNGWSAADASGAWSKGRAGFGSNVVKGSTTRKVSTIWNTPEIWLKRSFHVDKKSVGNLMLRIQHDGDSKVFLNGNLIYEKTGPQYITWNLDQKAASYLKDGENFLQVYGKKGQRSGFLDVSLFDMKDTKGDDILYSPGQPNILRGTNGFEWWLIYMANKNRERRSQYINRVHFFDKTMFVDGVTSSNTSGYHPAPTPPTFKDLFDTPLGAEWEVKAGNWSVVNKELVQSGISKATSLLKSTPAIHYLFEVNIKIADTLKGQAGVFAWWKDDNNWLKIGVDAKRKKWSYIVKEKGIEKPVFFALPSAFNYGVYHQLSVYKNGGTFTIRLDDHPIANNPVITTRFNQKGIPGLYSEGGNSAFDGVIYTIGWDEFDNTITGWETPGVVNNGKGNWAVSKNGITSPGPKGTFDIFKGDLLPNYEISVQVNTAGKTGNAGIYPVYINGDNYVKAVFDLQHQELSISGKIEGKEMEHKAIALEKTQDYNIDMKYSDSREKYFSFSTSTLTDGILISKTPYGQPDTLMNDIYRKMDIWYKQEDQWLPLTGYQEVPSSHPGFIQLKFEPLEANAIRFVNKVSADANFYLNKVWVKEKFRPSYNLRIVKLDKELIFLVDGAEVLRLKNEFGPSKIGLTTTDNKAGFNGITLFHIPQ